jgi:hypothetical protein
VSAAYRLADEIDFDVRLGLGTTIFMRKFASPLPRQEVAILARPCRGETVIGDDAAFVRGPDGLLVALADGLGHGPPAYEASCRAIAVVHGQPHMAPAELLEACGQAMAGTRGAVMAIGRIDQAAGEVLHAAVGNVTTYLHRDRQASRFSPSPGVLGAPGRSPRVQTQRAAIAGRYVLIMFSDGLSSRLDPAADPGLLREPALVIAHRLLVEHGRDHDDATVLVATG